jgi:release factor glutamine methyltransferase
VLLAHALGWRRARLHAWPEALLTPAQSQAYGDAIRRRTEHEPVPYITGHREFYGLEFRVDRRVLIPRPETELLVEQALQCAGRSAVEQLRLVDVGTGSGAVAVTLAMCLPEALVYAVDTCQGALEVAAQNADRLGVSARVRCLRGDLLSPLPEPVHMIVANLPYVARDELAQLAPDVLEYEPHGALDGGSDGLAIINRLLAGVQDHLLPGGSVHLEIGCRHGAALSQLVQRQHPQAHVQVFADIGGLDRVLSVEF